MIPRREFLQRLVAGTAAMAAGKFLAEQPITPPDFEAQLRAVAQEAADDGRLTLAKVDEMSFKVSRRVPVNTVYMMNPDAFQRFMQEELTRAQVGLNREIARRYGLT